MLDSQRSEAQEMFTVFKVSFTLFSLLLIYDYYYTETLFVVRLTEPKFSLMDPYHTVADSKALQQANEDKYDKLIDIDNFKFTVNPQPCKNYSEGLFMVILVASNPDHVEMRTVIRRTWGRSSDSTKVVFLMGEVNSTEKSEQIQREVDLYGDIVQGTFIDAYRNMTYKHTMGLKWVSHYCPNAKYVLKMDDDAFVNTRELNHFLARELSPWGAKGLILCRVLKHAKVQRSKKWKVSFEEYEYSYYPNYCAGYAIIYSQDVVPRLLKALQETSYFWIDDVHVTGVIAQQLLIARTSLDDLALADTRGRVLTSNGPQYVGKFLFGPQDMSSENISKVWKALVE